MFESFECALRWRENATIKKKCGQLTKYSDVINFYSILININRAEKKLIMFCYDLLYWVDKRRGSERAHRDDGEQMKYISACTFVFDV